MGFDGVYHDLFQIFFNPVLTKFEVPEKEKNYILKFYLVGITAINMAFGAYNWRYRYPEFDNTQRWVKVPSQELSDMLVEALKDKE